MALNSQFAFTRYRICWLCFGNGNKQGKLQGDSIGTKIAQLFVLDLIYALLVQGEEELAAQTKQKTLNVILEQRIK